MSDPERDTADRAAALAELILRAQPETEPSISSLELDPILDKAKRASTWVAEADYTVGAVVMPSTRNGHRYECVAPGMSSDAEPAFPTGYEATVADGDSLVWREAGKEYGNVYDVRRAENLVAKLRRVKSLEYEGGPESEIYKRCVEEERRTAPIVFA